MPGAFAYCFDFIAQKWKRNPHRADYHPYGLFSGAGVFEFFDNPLDYGDFLVTSLYLYIYVPAAGFKHASMAIYTETDVLHSIMAYAGCYGPNASFSARSFPIPFRVWPGAKLKVTGITAATIVGGVDGTWEMAA